MLALAICLAVFLTLAVREIALPGLYMDEVNPDYLIVKMLDKSKVGTTPSWQSPDNFLSRNLRWPLILSHYTGTISPYIGVPFHALWGFNITSLRLYHSFYGIIIITLVFSCIYQATGNKTSAFLGSILLALDAGFVLSFRTQYQLILVPLPFLLVANLLLLRYFGPSRSDHVDTARSKPSTAGIAPVFLAGLCYGLSCWGYFIFWFYLPGLLLTAVYLRHQLSWRHIFAFGGGTTLGYGPWFFAMYSIWRATPTTGDFIASFQQNVQTFVVTNNTFADRVLHTWILLKGVIVNLSQPWMVAGTTDAAALTEFKAGLVLAVFIAACAGLWLAGSQRERRAGWVVLLLMLSFLAVAPFAGQRLSYHHLNVNLPLLYLFIGISVAPGLRLLRGAPAASTVRAPVVALMVLLFGFISMQQQSTLFRELRKSGGNGHFSEARTYLPYDLLANYRNAVVFFPEWGFFMQAVYLTAGELRIPPTLVPTPEFLRGVLCTGQDAVIVVDGIGHRHLAELPARGIGVSVTSWKTFHQRDGKPNFEMAVISSHQAGINCSRAGSSAIQ